MGAKSTDNGWKLRFFEQGNFIQSPRMTKGKHKHSNGAPKTDRQQTKVASRGSIPATNFFQSARQDAMSQVYSEADRLIREQIDRAFNK